jgi:hypothetical protein
MLLGRGLARRSLRFGLGGDMAIWVQPADGAVAFAKDLAAFFDEGLDLVDEGFFVELVFGGPFGFFDGLSGMLGIETE